MDIMACMVDELRGTIEDAALGHDKRRFVMLSHNDLDGIGCTILTGHVVESFGYGSLNPKESFFNRKAIFPRNTGKFVPALYAELDLLLFEASTSEEHHQIVALITDLGNVTIEDLYKRYRQYNHGHITFIVVDHHRHPYELVPDVPYTTEKVKENHLRHYQLTHIEETHSTLGYLEDGPFFRVYTWSGYNGKCATGMLAALFDQGGIYSLTKNVLNWTEMINRWDTGKGGQWYIPEGAPYTGAIAPEVKMYHTWNMPMTIPGTDKQEHLRNMEVNMIRYLNMDNNFDVDVHEPTIVETLAVQMSREYDRFVQVLKNRQVRVVEALDHGDVIAAIDGTDITFKIPASQACKLSPSIDSVIRNARVFINDESTRPWSITLFSTRLFEAEKDDELGAVLLIGISIDTEKGTARVELRSSPTVNSYEIAKTNGGGGHPGAAGFILNI